MRVAPRRDLKRTAAVGAALLLLVAPAFISFNYIFRFGVDVPYWDEWQFVPLLGEFLGGKLPLELLTSQHNEHRIVLPRICMLVLAWLTRYDTVAEMYASWLMLCVIILLYFVVHTRSLGCSLSSLTTFIPISWVVLSLRQYENLLWSWQVQIALASLLLVATLFLIESSLARPRRLALAILTAAGCTFSFGIGLGVWPTGLAQLLLLRRRAHEPKRNLCMIGAWVVSGACCVALYLWGYQAPGHHPPFLRLDQDPRAFFLALCAVLGNPFTSTPAIAPKMGGIILALVVAVLLLGFRGRIHLDRAPLAIPLSLSSLFAALLVVTGRGGLGLPDLTLSRYVTLVVPCFVGAQMAILAVKDRWSRFFLKLVVFSLAGFAIFASFDGTYAAGRERRESMLARRRILLEYRFRPDSDLAELFIDPSLVRTGADVLREYRLSAFRNAQLGSATRDR